MKLTDIGTIKQLMATYNINFKKKFGQNFLTNESVLKRIAQNAAEGVIEIGPGIGPLTYELCSVCEKVVAVEIDTTLIPVLTHTLSAFSNVKIINDDILKIDLKKLIAEEFPEKKVSVCANLPYYITTPVIMHLLESEIKFDSITVMVQKEVAQRLCAKPGDDNYGAITAAVSYYGKALKLFDVSAGNFIPAPKVDSSVLKISLYDSPPVECKDKKMLFRVIKGAFAQRRKTLLNSLSSEFGHLNKTELSDVLSACSIDPGIRGEMLSLEQFAIIADKIGEKINKI